MNKKVLTLCASFLLAGGMLSMVNALPANPTQIETRVASTEVAEAVQLSVVPTLSETFTAEGILDEFTNNARLFVLSDENGDGAGLNRFLYNTAEATTNCGTYPTSDYASAYWTYQADGRFVNNNDEVLTLAESQTFEIVPVVTGKDKKATPFFLLRAGKKYVQRTSGNGGASVFSLVDQADNASFFVSVQTAYSEAYTADELNKVTSEGFALSFAVAEGDDSAVVGTDAFAGSLKAVDNDKDGLYKLTTSDAKKVVVFDEDDQIGDNQSAKKGAFSLVDEGKQSDYNYYFKIYKADNDTKAVKVDVASSKQSNATVYTAFIATLGTTNYLTAGTDLTNAKLPYIKLGATDVKDLKELLTGEFVEIYYEKTGKESTSNKYKINGVLSVNNTKTGDEADYVAKSTVLTNAPEIEWALTLNKDENLVLTNRENTNVSITIDELRYTDKAGVYKVVGDDNINGDLITINFVKNHKKTDGFKVYTKDELRNTAYYLGQSRQNEGDDITAYWSENHAGSHIIGATVDKEIATKWNISLAEKADKAETDSVFIVSTMNVWKDGKLTEKQDTLVILPYKFQNRSNSEYVDLNADDKLNYYICNPSKKVEDAQMFALKMKPNGTYNYVTVDKTGYVEEVGDSKVYNFNSLENGTWKDMNLYAEDANSLLIVENVDAPEYRKLVSTLGVDTVSIYRDENESEVIYEQRNDKAIVEDKALSFLNIENLNDPKFDINPAIYVDSAYVNRGNNKCWQYLLAVNVEEKLNTFCPDNPTHNTEEWIKEHGVCPHAIKTPYLKARFLVNLIDTANIYGATHLHNNPYINQTEEGDTRAKLAFVPGFHVGDSLYLVTNSDTVCVDLRTPNFTIGKFAFKYVDAMNSDAFKIQTAYKDYTPEAETYDPNYTNEGFLRWTNGCIVVDKGYERGDVFNMAESYEGTPTANEEISANAAVSVVATDGAVIVKGAEGKNVIVSTILGKVVANEVMNSDNETIAAPAGIVVVSVDGESFKVAVK